MLPAGRARVPRFIAMNAGVPVRVHSLDGDDLGIAHVPWPVSPGDVLEFGGDGPIRPLRITHLVETGRMFPIAALVKAALAPELIR
jgi:hypothetical protein